MNPDPSTQDSDASERYRQMLDAAQVILWRTTVETPAVTFVSAEAERLLGYPVPRWLDDPDFGVKITHPEDRSRVVAAYREAAHTKQCPPFEHRMIASDGRVVWFRTSIRAVQSNGALTELAGAMLDITELKQAQQALEQQRHLFSALMTNVPYSIYFKDLESRFVLVNQAQATLLGLTRAGEAVGKSDADFFDAAHAAEARQDELEIVRSGKTIVNKEEKESWPDGRVTWASTTKMPLLDGAGHTVGTLGISRNITARKLAEDKLRERTAEVLETNERLQREIMERRLLEGQLVQAQKLESIGQLAAGIAHELNTPIQYIGDNVRFLRDAFSAIAQVLDAQGPLVAQVEKLGILPELVSRVTSSVEDADLAYLLDEAPRAIDQCGDGVTRVAAIVMAMKEFSHPGKAEQECIDINHAIGTTMMVCRNEWKYVAEAVTDLAPGLPAVRCFPGEFNQVILNLVVNAAQALAGVKREPGKLGRIVVSTRSAGEWVEIRVTDNGTGIPAAARPRIFTPFFTTKEIGKGTGQGLAIAHSVIVKKHGGTIDFETEENVGTTFLVRLPVDGIGMAGAA